MFAYYLKLALRSLKRNVVLTVLMAIVVAALLRVVDLKREL